MKIPIEMNTGIDNDGVPMGRYVISAFPGTGKSTASETESTDGCRVIDLESSTWSHDGSGNRNPHFPLNYMREIERLHRTNTFVLVSSHEDVRRLMYARPIRFIYVVPDINSKEEYLERYAARGNSREFIDNVDDNWDEWLSDDSFKGTDFVETLGPGEYVSDLIRRMKTDPILRLRFQPRRYQDGLPGGMDMFL